MPTAEIKSRVFAKSFRECSAFLFGAWEKATGMNGVKRLLTVKDVALMLSAKESTVYQWAELGQIPCIKLNGSLRFDIDDISVWIESCKKQVTSAYNPLLRLEARKGGEN